MSGDAPILWLASWYPNRLDPFTGDFIQRHAMAVAAGRKVHVIFLRRDPSLPQGSLQIKTTQQGMLTEDIGLYNSRGNGRLLSFLYYVIYYRRLIQNFLNTHGRPALVHVHVGLRAGIMALSLRKKSGLPYVLTEHWTGYNRTAEPNLWKQGRVARWTAAAIFKQASVVMPVSADLGKQIKMVEPRAAIAVINNVVDTSLFYFRQENTEAPYTFLHASSLKAQKNPELLLKAFQVLSGQENWRLVVAGPVTEKLRQLATELGLTENVDWLGEISYRNVAKEMQNADCFVLSSRFENSPCVIGEALCCGVPVVSTNVGGVSELVGMEQGTLVESEDLHALQQAILQMYQKIRKWDREGLASASAAKFSYPVIAGMIEKNYASALANT